MRKWIHLAPLKIINKNVIVKPALLPILSVLQQMYERVCIVYTMWTAKQTHTRAHTHKKKKNLCCSPVMYNSFVLLPAACCVLAKQTVLHSWTTYGQRNIWTRLEGREGQRQTFHPQVKIGSPCVVNMRRWCLGSSAGGLTQYLLKCYRGVQWCEMRNLNENFSPKQNSALGLSFVASLTWRWTDVTSVSVPARQSGR